MTSSDNNKRILSVGLAIFSMLFGAGNLMYPVKVGIESGTNNLWGMIGFTITAICIPLAGLIGMILFNGDYNLFFKRLGEVPGSFLIGASTLILGPIIAIPRIVTLSHTMIAPFIPFLALQDPSNIYSSALFACIFLGLTFLLTFRENRIVDLLGYIISPLLLASLVIIIAKGIIGSESIVETTTTPLSAFINNMIRGYQTLDLLGTIFFTSIVLQILKNTIGGLAGYNERTFALIALKSGTLGVSLLAGVYFGLSYLGVFHGHGFQHANEGELFRSIAFKVVGNGGGFIISMAVLMACFSTAIALAAVFAEYLQRTLFRNKISYASALIIGLGSCMPLSIFGLSYVLHIAGGPILYIGYPVIIALTFCNIAYKLFDFKPVKTPVFLTFVGALASYLYFQ